MTSRILTGLFLGALTGLLLAWLDPLLADRAVAVRLWNPFVAAWYEGKDAP